MKYGEFVDAMQAVAKISIEAETFFEEWCAMATEEEWKRLRELPLEEGEIRNFVEDMATYFRELINGTCTDALYSGRVKDGHAFLEAIRAKCIELDIDVSNIQFDVPLALGESIRMAQEHDPRNN